MICQDDNFTCLTREYGREQTGIVAVPTLDWREVKDIHYQSCIHRALESRYTLVRAGAISAIISPHGEILDRRDHFLEGPGIAVAEVPVYRHSTLFSIWGHGPMVAGAVAYILFYLIYRRKKQSVVELSAPQGNQHDNTQGDSNERQNL